MVRATIRVRATISPPTTRTDPVAITSLTPMGLVTTSRPGMIRTDHLITPPNHTDPPTKTLPTTTLTVPTIPLQAIHTGRRITSLPTIIRLPTPTPPRTRTVVPEVRIGRQRVSSSRRAKLDTIL